VIDQTGSAEPRTNGTHATSDTEGSGLDDGSASSFDGGAIDDRLDALLQSIREWDWRTAPAEGGAADRDAPVSVAGPRTTTAVAETAQDLTPPTPDSLSVQDAVDAPTVVREPMPSSPEPVEPPPPADSGSAPERPSDGTDPRHEPTFESAPAEPPPPFSVEAPSDDATNSAAEDGEGSEPITPGSSPIQVTSETQPVRVQPVAIPLSAAADPTGSQVHGSAVGDSTAWLKFGYGPESKPDPDWQTGQPRSRTRLKVLGLGALCLILAGALAFGLIRLFDKSTTSPGQTATTTIPPTPSATNQSHAATTLSSSQVIQYEGYAQSLQTANLAAAHLYDSAGTAPTTTKLTLEVIQYGKELTSYNNDLDAIAWPATMQSAIQADHAQLRALLSFLGSFSIVKPAGVSAWLVQLHGRTSTAQTADNRVRQDLGLPITTSFP
jgi:hypothetical protein